MEMQDSSSGHSASFGSEKAFIDQGSANAQVDPELERLILKHGPSYYRIDHEIESLGGDQTERHGWKIFGKEKFPEYEVFWRNYVVPITDRLKRSIHYKPDASYNLVVISSIHFSIYSNFDFVYTCWNGNAKKYYDEKFNKLSSHIFDLSMFKLTNTCDLVEQFLYNWYMRKGLLTKKYFKLRKIKALKNLAKETAAQTMDDMIKYPDVHVTLVRRTKVLETFLKEINPEARRTFKKFNEFAIKIRNYRDIVAHSWESFHIENKVPKPQTLTRYQNWRELSKIIKSNNRAQKEKMLEDDFVEMHELILNYADTLITLINILWENTVTSESSPSGS